MAVSRRRALLAGLPLIAGGCATLDDTAANDWHDVPVPGKPRTDYRWERAADGLREIVAQADRSASMYRKRLDASAQSASAIEFSWWTQSLPAGGDVATADATDSAARVLLAFDGDHSRLPARDRMLFELTRTLTGEAPPYATLAYVWDTRAALDSVVVHPRSGRMRKIVVESGSTGLGQWRRYRRSIRDDYRRSFGEAPGRLLAVAVMTDGDNTGSRLLTRYRDIALR